MIRKIVFISTFLLLSISFATAETVDWDEEDFEYIHQNMDAGELKDKINSNQEDIPGFVARIVGDQRINVYFQESGENYSAVMEGTFVEEFERDLLDEPTLEMRINESSVDAVIDSEESISEIKEQLDEGGIEYEALNRSNQVRMFITETVIDISSRFSIF